MSEEKYFKTAYKTPKGYFKSLDIASKVYNVSRPTITKRFSRGHIRFTKEVVDIRKVIIQKTYEQ